MLFFGCCSLRLQSGKCRGFHFELPTRFTWPVGEPSTSFLLHPLHLTNEARTADHKGHFMLQHFGLTTKSAQSQEAIWPLICAADHLEACYADYSTDWIISLMCFWRRTASL